MPNHVFADDVGIFFGVFEHVRTWPNDANISEKNVKKLGQLIQVRLPKKFTNSCNASIILSSMNLIGFIIHAHTAEFITIKYFVIAAGTLLYKKYRSFGIKT